MIKIEEQNQITQTPQKGHTIPKTEGPRLLGEQEQNEETGLLREVRRANN